MGVQDAPQMARTHAHAIGQGADLPCTLVGCALVHPCQGLVCQHVAGVLVGPPQGLARCQLWAASQAGPEAGPFGLGWVGEKLAVVLHGRARFAHRSTVNTCAAHAKEKKPIKTRIARAQGLVAGAGLEGQVVGCHAGMLRRVRCRKWSDSDMLMDPARAFLNTLKQR